jgi:chromosome segregation ATPase
MKEWKDPLDEKKALVKNYSDAVERLTGEKAEAKTDLDKADNELNGEPDNQEKKDAMAAAQEVYDKAKADLTEAQGGYEE